MNGKVLVVDDDLMMLDVVADMLVAAGFLVTTESTSFNVVPRIQAERPNVVVLDVLMPGMTAVEIMTRLSQEDYRPPVVLHTGTLIRDMQITPSGDQFLAQMYRLGVVAVCIKGGSMDCIIRSVTAAVIKEGAP